MIQNSIDSLLRTNIIYKLFLVDNSLSDNLRFLKNKDSRIIYIHNPSNPGFGAAHNIAIKKSIDVDSKYHFIVNPDIYFERDVITPMVNYMEQNNDVGMVMPQILNIDSTMQNLPKLLPSPLGLLLRKLKRPNWYYNK
ncbi:MAG: glycosyltransferase, partial [Flavobacteriaceae bacterium]